MIEAREVAAWFQSVWGYSEGGAGSVQHPHFACMNPRKAGKILIENPSHHINLCFSVLAETMADNRIAE